MKTQTSTKKQNTLKVVGTNSLETIEKELTVKTLGELTDQVTDLKANVAELKAEAKEVISLTPDEAFDLKGLMFAATWYNDEANAGSNEIIEILLSGMNKRNSSEIITTIQLLNKIAYNRDLINRIHDRAKFVAELES